MKKTILLMGSFALLFIFNSVFSQVTIWTEDFEAATGNGGYNGANGNWIVTPVGTNGAQAGKWRVNDTECGGAPGSCGSAGCGDQSLFMGTSDALYGAGFTGAALLADPTGETHKRIESPIIDCSVHTNITIKFDYIESRVGGGGDADDDATLWYFDGTTWAAIDPIAITPNTCDPQGTWTEFTTFNLPASADNNANVQIGFQWIADADANGIDPSFAVDDILIEGIAAAGASVTASFTQDIPTPICEGTTVIFTDASTANNTAINSWAWVFDGGDTPTANTQGPHSITFNTSGTYDIDLTVGDGVVSNTSTVSLVVVAEANAGNNNAANLCDNTTLDLTTLLNGADAGGTWTETSGAPSGQFVGSTLDGNGLTLGNIYTFDYTVTGNAPCPDDVSSFTITIDCAVGTAPTASFTASQLIFCAEDCITFTDNSVPGDISTWTWDFDGGAVNSTSQDPGNVCFFNAGTFNVTLTVTNPFGSNTSAVTTITVIPLPTVTASASTASTICSGEETILTGGGTAINYIWDNGVNDGISFLPNFGPNNFTVTGTDVNGCENSASISINVIDCEPMIAGFSYPDNICVGTCVTFTDTTTGFPTSWSWDFGPDITPISSSEQNPEMICFNTPGVYEIQLTVTDGIGDVFSTTNSITVLESPTITTELDTLIDLGGYAELISFSPSIGNYLWTPDTYYIECDTCSTTLASPLLDTDYIVVFTDLNGCSVQDTVKVTVTFIEGIGVPQAFSPNGDGHNDQLVVKGLGIDQMNFKIYNRYGQLIFETDEQNHGWDGSFKGKAENPGVFVWVLDYELLNGTRNLIKGTTTLIR